MWERFRLYADSNFRTAAQKRFQPRYWEMHLATVLLQSGYVLVPASMRSTGGPDILTTIDGKRLWIECVCVEGGTGPTRFPCSRQGKGYTVPDQQVTLRLLNAIDKKRKQWEKSLASEIVSLQDLHIIAVNTALIDLAGLEITPPRIVKAVYGIGDQYVMVNLETKKVIGSGYHPRFAIPKASGKSVDSALFVSAAASDVSAVLYSRAGLFRTYSEHLTSTDVERLGRASLPYTTSMRRSHCRRGGSGSVAKWCGVGTILRSFRTSARHRYHDKTTTQRRTPQDLQVPAPQLGALPAPVVLLVQAERRRSRASVTRSPHWPACRRLGRGEDDRGEPTHGHRQRRLPTTAANHRSARGSRHVAHGRGSLP